MAVAFDAASGPAGQPLAAGDYSWTHTPTGTPRGVIVFCVADAPLSSLTFDSVTYAGLALEQGTPANLVGGESGQAQFFFLGAGLPTGAQTVLVNTTGTGQIVLAAVTLTAGDDLEIVDSDLTINSISQADPSVTLQIGTRTSFAAIAFFSGQNAVTGIAPLTNWTNIGLGEVDFGTATGGLYRYTVISDQDITAGWTQTADDAVAVTLAVSQLAPWNSSNMDPFSPSPSPYYRINAATAAAAGTFITDPFFLGDPLPFASGDWPNPSFAQAVAAYHLSVGTEPEVWQNRLPLRLPDAIATSQLDWPNPSFASRLSEAHRAIEAQAGVWQNPINMVAVIAPFFQLDWPNPSFVQAIVQRFLAIEAQAEAWQNRLSRTETVAPSQTDWPNPLLRANPYLAAIEAQAGVWQNRPASTTPFFQLDWPNPSFRVWLMATQLAIVTQDDVWVNRLPLRLPDAIPPSQSDWPNPSFRNWILGYLAAIEAQAEAWQNRLSRTESIAPSQTDWPNPSFAAWIARAYGAVAAELDAWQNTNPGVLIVPPFAQLDWPNPSFAAQFSRAYLASIESQFEVWVNRLPLRAADPIPVSQTDWPNPSFARQAILRQIAISAQSDVWIVLPLPVYTAARNDLVLVSGTGTIQLTAAAVVGIGGVIGIKNTGTGTITVKATGSETIEGASTRTMTEQNEAIVLITNGANWFIV